MIDDEDGEVRALPPWREALKRFLAEGFRPGDVVPHEWFADALGLTIPTLQMPYGEARRFEVLYLKHLECLKEVLLSDHNVLLVSQHGVGYRYVPPAEQAALSFDAWERLVKKETRRGVQRMVCTDLLALTAEQRREHAEIQAKFIQRQSMLRQRLPRMLPGPGDD